jgi:hypothetical protein
MSGTNDLSSAELAEQLGEMITASWMAQAACVAAELRLADLLRDGPRSSGDLASVTGVEASCLHRLLCALCTINICRQVDDGTFAITPLGASLDSTRDNSIANWAIWWGKHLWPVWGNLLYSVTTGKSARSMLKGTEGFAHLENDPNAAATFNKALAELTHLESHKLLRAYDFSQFKKIVDVGGGNGELLAKVLAINPGATGVLFDMPHAIDAARRRLSEEGLGDRVDCVTGDFFKSIPSGGDGYIIKNVIHDWDDERSKHILVNCRAAMDANAKLLLIERLIPKRPQQTTAHQSAARSDLTMLVALAAKERTEDDFRRLLTSARFEVAKIYPAGTLSIIEASPR